MADRDPLSYLYTSGTTSFPQGVVGSHTATYLESLSMAAEASFNETDRFVAMMPMFHTARLLGTPVVNVQAAIMDEKGTLLAQGEEGEIVYRGPRTLTGLP